jgi:hypothetical protein
MRLSGNGRWIADDGKPGKAFSGEHFEPERLRPPIGGWPMAWSCECACLLEDHQCNANKARAWTSARFKCSNGESRPEVKR